MKQPPEKVLLKDQLFNKERVSYLANRLKKTYPKLNKAKFETDIFDKFPQLELMERFYWIREMFEKHLPQDYEETLKLLLKSLKNIPQKESFIFASYSNYVEVHGCSKEHLQFSLDALGEFTSFCSAEFAIRTFINKFPQVTFQKMQEWSKSKDFHQRRLASEGLRPKLPWAKAITFDYKKGSDILNHLFYDKERYVTRSVANHLNDISKIDPDFVLEKLGKWKESQKQQDREMNYIIKHSLRTSIKKGHVNTFSFLGYNSDLKLTIKNLKVEQEQILLGDSLKFSFELGGRIDENLIIDYKITYPTPHKRVSQKVFKIKTTKIKKDEILLITKNHPFRKMTTKRLYTGTYSLEIQINGKILDSIDFYLEI